MSDNEEFLKVTLRDPEYRFGTAMQVRDLAIEIAKDKGRTDPEVMIADIVEEFLNPEVGRCDNPDPNHECPYENDKLTIEELLQVAASSAAIAVLMLAGRNPVK